MTLPNDFDWEIYLKLHPDIADCCKTEETAKLHYIHYGFNEKRKYKVKLP